MEMMSKKKQTFLESWCSKRDGATGEFLWIFKEWIISTCLPFLGCVGKKERLLNSFCEASLMQIFKPDREDKIKLQTNLTYEY